MLVKENTKLEYFSLNVTKFMGANGISKEQMAALLGIGVRTFADKLKDPRRFTLDEIVRITEQLKFDEYSFKQTFCFK